MHYRSLARLGGWLVLTGWLAAGGPWLAAAPFTVTTTNDFGDGSLRAAISNANDNAGLDTILFNITDAGVQTIVPASPLPAITDSVLIDGYSQSGSSSNTLANGDGAVLLIQLDGSVAGGSGLVLATSDSTVRGLVIRGFLHGIDVSTGTNNVIAGNFLGPDASGTNAVPAGASIGVAVSSAGNQIGGSDPADRNLISGNGGAGIELDAGALNTRVLGNLIGSDRTGAQPLSNGGAGVSVASSGNLIGDLAGVAGNRIAFNTGAGIVVLDDVAVTNNSFLGNSLLGNTGLGIDLLAPGETGGTVTTNDVCDADEGGNHLQNFPVITLATNLTSSVNVQGLLVSAPDASYRIEFFSNTTCDPSGFGQGETFLGATNLLTDAGCSNAFSVTLPVVLPNDLFVTATATDADGNTSEFSNCDPIQNPGLDLACALAPALATNQVGQAHTVTATVTTNSNPAVGVTVSFAVVTGPNTNAATADVITSVAGQAVFQYTGTGGLGQDTIRAIGTVSGHSFTSTATKVWIAAVVTNRNPIAVAHDVIAVANGQCQAVVNVAEVDNGSSDPDGDPITLSLNHGVTFPLGPTPVTLTVADNHGGTNTSPATVTVVDRTSPVIECPATIFAGIAAEATNAVVSYPTPVASDNCSTVSLFFTPPSGTTFPRGTNQVVLTAFDPSGNTNHCAFSVIVQTAPPGAPGPHDLAVIKLKVPKTINLKAGLAVTKPVVVTIQNRSPHDEKITSFAGLVTLVARSLSNVCPNATVVLHSGSPNVGKTLKPAQKMNVSFDVTFDCANDHTKGAGHEDFAFTATVHHEAIDGLADTHPACDTCPRGPLPGGVDPNPNPNKPIKDPGCGNKDKATHQLGAPVLTDVVVK